MRTRTPARRRLTRALTVAVITMIATMGVHTPAIGAPTPNTGDDSQLSDHLDDATMAIMRQQEALQPAISVLYNAIQKLPDSGFASIAFEDTGVALYWKGTLPNSMIDAVATVSQLASVQIYPARFSKAELEKQADAIMSAGGNASDIQKIQINNDGSGLTIETMLPSTAAARRTKLGRDLSHAEQLVASLGLLAPVTIEQGGAPVQYTGCAGACSRTDDTSPWNAGGFINNANIGYGCTSGFAMWYPAKGQSYVMTAAHCGTPPSTWFADSTGEVIGAAEYEDWDKDILLIDARGMHWVFDGGPNSTFHKTVHSWGYHMVDEYLCQSGSASGVKCGLKTLGGDNYRLYLCDSDGDCFYVHGLIAADKVDGTTPAIVGDSGGPVFSLDGDGVRAKGSMTGVQGNTLYFQDLADPMRAWGAYPVTN